MDKTRVDDMLIEMISPKIKEIEEKFSQGKGLNQEDINTLLLKSQYNHINHLDNKLNEISQTVIALEGKFQNLEGKFQHLEGKFETFKEEMSKLFEQSQVKMQETIINTMKWYIGGTGIILIALKSLDVFVK
jgi:predicted nuclease with TOPRIM domain